MPRYDPVPLAGRRALVIGLGRHGGGVGVVHHLHRRGASVVVTDVLDADALAASVARLDDLEGVELVLGGHGGVDPAAFDLVVRNPALPHEHPLLVAARAAGVAVHSEATLFVRDFPGRVVAVTGSKGKTSTCYFLAHLLSTPTNAAHLVGNMGGSALDVVDGSDATSIAVFEASSFQVEAMAEAGVSAPVACLTSLHPDHLDRYGDAATYYAAKAPLFELQRADDWRVMPPPDELPAGLLWRMPGRWACAGRDDPEAEIAAWVAEGTLTCRVGSAVTELVTLDAAAVEGAHRVANVVVAVAAALATGVGAAALAERLRELPGVPHRMELVPSGDGRRWINDTAATNPTAAGAGIRSTGGGERVAVICGGASKQLDPDPLVDALVAVRPRIVLLAGDETDVIADRLAIAEVPIEGIARSMEEAVAMAAAVDPSVVLLSPGCSSFGMFRHEFDRGAAFIAAVVERDGVSVDDALRAAFEDPRHRPLRQLLAEHAAD